MKETTERIKKLDPNANPAEAKEVHEFDPWTHEVVSVAGPDSTYAEEADDAGE